MIRASADSPRKDREVVGTVGRYPIARVTFAGGAHYYCVDVEDQFGDAAPCGGRTFDSQLEAEQFAGELERRNVEQPCWNCGDAPAVRCCEYGAAE